MSFLEKVLLVKEMAQASKEIKSALYEYAQVLTFGDGRKSMGKKLKGGKSRVSPSDYKRSAFVQALIDAGKMGDSQAIDLADVVLALFEVCTNLQARSALGLGMIDPFEDEVLRFVQTADLEDVGTVKVFIGSRARLRSLVMMFSLSAAGDTPKRRIAGFPIPGFNVEGIVVHSTKKAIDEAWPYAPAMLRIIKIACQLPKLDPAI